MSGITNPARWFIDWVREIYSGGESKVTAETMLRLAAVWYGITKISGHVAQMPIDVKWRLDQGAEDYTTHPWRSRLRGRVNAYQTVDIWKEQMQGHALAWGNGRSAILRGPVYELIPLMPDRTITCLVHGEKYHVTKPNTHDRLWTFETAQQDFEDLKHEMIYSPEKVVVLHDRDVLHIQGFGYDGVTGKSLYDVARDSMGIGLQTSAYANKQLKRGFAGQVMLTAPPGVFTKEEEAQKFLENFRKAHDLAQDGETIGLLRQGITAQIMQASNRDSQMVERLKFDRQDVMLWLGLETMPGEEARGGYNGLIELNLAYLINCLGRWLTKWEMQLNSKLRTETEIRVDRMYFKFNTKTLLKMDLQKTVATLGNAIASKIMNSNEARDVLDLPAREGGDKFENPAISTDPPQPNDEYETDIGEMAQARMRGLIKIESQRVMQACMHDNFIAAIDKFYAKWGRTIAEAMQAIKLDPSTELAAMEKRRGKLLDIAGRVTTADDLTNAVNAETESWRKYYAEG